jgi:hypothetical protein
LLNVLAQKDTIIMKNYRVIIALTIGLLSAVFLIAQSNDRNPKGSTPQTCCQKCDDKQCQEYCKTYRNMTEDQKAGAAGKEVKEACLKICKEKKCCGEDGTCSTMSEKGCCSTKKK